MKHTTTLAMNAFAATKHLPTRLPSLPRRRTRVVTRAVPVDLEHALRHLAAGLPPLAEIQSQVTTALYSIADADGVVDAVQTVTAAATSDAAVETAKEAATKTGPFTFIADALEGILKVIDSGLEALHVPYSYGFSIIILTVLVKIITFPLSKQQVESSIAMQALQPQIREIQEKNKNNPQMAQQLTAQLYQNAGVNPLAGCLPTLATIPVFIGLYRALLNAADEGILKEGFFVIPSLAGPTTISARAAGMGLSWLFPFKDGAPPIGWHDAGAYLVLPTLLVFSQYISQSILQTTKSDDPSQSGAQTFLKVLPLLLGWFSLNVPSGLTLYWITNNALTTGQQLYLKRGVQTPTMTKTPSAPTMTRTPTRNDVVDTVAVPTPDTKLTGKESGARRSKKQREAQEVGAMAQSQKGRRGERFRARKAREAAKRAQSQSKRLSKKQRKPFIEEKPNADVIAQFEKELAATPVLPLSEDKNQKQPLKTEARSVESVETQAKAMDTSVPRDEKIQPAPQENHKSEEVAAESKPMDTSTSESAEVQPKTVEARASDETQSQPQAVEVRATEEAESQGSNNRM